MNEIIFLFFLLSGVFKTFLDFMSISTGVDITLLSSILILVLMVINFYASNFKIKITRTAENSILALICLFALTIFSLSYTSSELYVYDKILRFLTLLIGFMFPLFVKDFSIDKFNRWFIIIVVVLTVIYLPLFIQSQSLFTDSYDSFKDDSMSVIHGHYLTMGYIIGAALIINSFTASFTYLYRAITSIILLFSLLATGARGPFIIYLVIIFLFILYKLLGVYKKRSFKKPKMRLAFFVLMAIVLTGGGGLVNKLNTSSLIERSYTRLTSMTSNDSAVDDRIDRVTFVIDSINFSNLFFGHGFGSYGFEKTGIDIRDYPHNIILEILFELGIFGVFIYFIFIFFILNKIIHEKCFFLWAILLYFFLNSLKSLSIVDSRLMFGFFSLILIFNVIDASTKAKTEVSLKSDSKIRPR